MSAKTLMALAVAATGLSLRAEVGDTLRFALPGWIELELVEVGGTTQLPLSFFYTGKVREALSEISAPRYWIGKFEVMQKQYEAIMGKNPSETKGERLPVTNVKWTDAVEFCDRLNQSVSGDIPKGYRFDLPTVVEWGHAYRAGSQDLFKYAGSDDLDQVAWHGKSSTNETFVFEKLQIVGTRQPNQANVFDMSGNVAEYVFLCEPKGGTIRIGGSIRLPERYCEITGQSVSPKDSAASDVGFRVALVPVAARDPDGKSCTMCTKGKMLLRQGRADLARKYLGIAMSFDGLTEKERLRIRETWLEADATFGYLVGDRHELLATISGSLEESGYAATDPIRYWDSQAESNDLSLQTALVSFYRRHRIYAMMVDAKELPKDVTRHFKASPRVRVQVVSCDFTGDGLSDLVVWLPGRTDDSGDEYGFFERQKEGGRYRLMGEPIRNVGLCILPKNDGTVGFVALVKMSDTTVAPGLLDCTDVEGKKCLRIAWMLPRSYYLRELEDEKVHPEMPFMGRDNSERAAYLATGKYQHTLCWPWPR